jgi:cyclopropane-fatty-acyl-phospholipid synthase
MLDRRMIYSCAYWANASTLETAQEAKLDLVCAKLGLERGQHVLDVGCGWGGALKYAVERHGIRGTGVTVSKEQAQLAREACAGLPVEILLTDYRALTGKFDHVFSIGMFEHGLRLPQLFRHRASLPAWRTLPAARSVRCARPATTSILNRALHLRTP